MVRLFLENQSKTDVAPVDVFATKSNLLLEALVQFLLWQRLH